MLTHNFSSPQKPKRVVVVGARGFIGKALVSQLEAEEIDFLPLTSDGLDLTLSDADEKLAAMLHPDDSVVMLSALTPDKGRGFEIFQKNMIIAGAVSRALVKTECEHVVYISSDAVYPMAAARVSEDSPAEPTDLYGAMHKSRELLLQETVAGSLAILRPTMVYGAGDTHSSYGPNRFRRVAKADGKIILGGQGEETRDHIHVEDVARVIVLTLKNKSSGTLNLVTGTSHSFCDVAKKVASKFDNVEVCFTERNNKITHRAYDNTQLFKAFPGFVFVPLEKGLDMAHEDVN